jgi:hypothetical protein
MDENLMTKRINEAVQFIRSLAAETVPENSSIREFIEGQNSGLKLAADHFATLLLDFNKEEE